MSVPEEIPLKKDKTTKKKTFKEKLISIKDNITVEPILTCQVIPSVLAKLATQNLNLDKACRVNLNFTDHVCDALIAKEGHAYMQEELAVQQFVAQMESWRNVLLTVIPSLLIIFIGAWSDRTGKRKICVLIPLVGELLMCLSNLLNAYFFYELPVQMAMFLDAFFPAITGGWVTSYMGAFAYISDVTSEESRTFRVGIANLCLTAGGPIGSVLSGVLLDKIGYCGVFTLSSILYVCNIMYGCFCMKDPERVKTVKSDSKNSNSILSFLKSFFNIKHVKDTMEVAFKKGPNNRRIKSILILASIVFIYGPSYGEGSMKYLFTRYSFNWDALMYSIYNTFYICMHGLGALISVTWFSHRLKWHDSVLGLISSFSKLIGSIATALSRNTRDMYIAVILETFNATSFTALRSLSSKLCTSDELGKMISFFNLVEVTTSMTFGPIYSILYSYTVKFNPGLMYYLSAGLTITPLVFFAWFFIDHRKTLRVTRNDCIDGNIMAMVTDNKAHEEHLVIRINLNSDKVVT